MSGLRGEQEFTECLLQLASRDDRSVTREGGEDINFSIPYWIGIKRGGGTRYRPKAPDLGDENNT